MRRDRESGKRARRRRSPSTSDSQAASEVDGGVAGPVDGGMRGTCWAVAISDVDGIVVFVEVVDGGMPACAGSGWSGGRRTARWCSFLRCRCTSPARRASSKTARAAPLARRRWCCGSDSGSVTVFVLQESRMGSRARRRWTLLGVIVRSRGRTAAEIAVLITRLSRGGGVGPVGRTNRASPGRVLRKKNAGRHRPQWGMRPRTTRPGVRGISWSRHAVRDPRTASSLVAPPAGLEPAT